MHKLDMHKLDILCPRGFAHSMKKLQKIALWFWLPKGPTKMSETRAAPARCASRTTEVYAPLVVSGVVTFVVNAVIPGIGASLGRLCEIREQRVATFCFASSLKVSVQHSVCTEQHAACSKQRTARSVK